MFILITLNLECGKENGMKTMTCLQLAGACNHEFHANTFDEISEQSRKHAMEMVQDGDKAHKAKMDEMMQLMQDPKAVSDWFDKVRKQFDDLQEDS
jgi:uncharacterized membrane protein